MCLCTCFYTCLCTCPIQRLSMHMSKYMSLHRSIHILHVYSHVCTHVCTRVCAGTSMARGSTRQCWAMPSRSRQRWHPIDDSQCGSSGPDKDAVLEYSAQGVRLLYAPRPEPDVPPVPELLGRTARQWGCSAMISTIVGVLDFHGCPAVGCDEPQTGPCDGTLLTTFMIVSGVIGIVRPVAAFALNMAEPASFFTAILGHMPTANAEGYEPRGVSHKLSTRRVVRHLQISAAAGAGSRHAPSILDVCKLDPRSSLPSS